MTDLPDVERSIPDQIVAELLKLLESRPEFDAASLQALRSVATRSRLTYESDVTTTLKCQNGGTDEAA